jgi:predicted small lipoprotein YifL
MIHRQSIAALALLALTACGSQRDLVPVAGAALPPAPYGRAERPTAAELLQLPPQAAPVRNEELRRQSEEREDDPFDLPPAN